MYHCEIFATVQDLTDFLNSINIDSEDIISILISNESYKLIYKWWR